MHLLFFLTRSSFSFFDVAKVTTHSHTRPQVCSHTHTCTHKNTHIHTYTCTHTYMHTHKLICAHLHTYMCTLACTHTHKCMHERTHSRIRSYIFDHPPTFLPPHPSLLSSSGILSMNKLRCFFVSQNAWPTN